MKGLEALEKIRNWKCFIDFEIDTNGNKEFGKEIAIIEKELKALEIINNKDVNTIIIKNTNNFDDYNKSLLITSTKKNAKYRFLIQKEYDLLKEILK